MVARLAEHIDNQVRAAVHNGRYVVELGAGLDIAAKPQDARDAIEVAVRRRLELGDEVDRAEPRGDDAVSKAAVFADRALDSPIGMGRQLARDLHDISRAGRREIRSEEHTSELQQLMRT